VGEELVRVSAPRPGGTKTPEELRRLLGRGAAPKRLPIVRDDVVRDPDVDHGRDGYVGEPPTVARKGRGALSNRSGRYEQEERLGFDDGWGSVAAGDDHRAAAGVHSYEPTLPSNTAGDDDPDADPPAAVDTIVTTEPIRSIITRNQSPDISFDRSINPYRGCEHGCIYCFARPTHAYLGLSPGLDFETRITAKPDAALHLRKELAHPRYECRVIAMGTNTDPYQPVEAKLGITRSILEVLHEHDHPVGIVTKNAGILRDVDLLAAMAKKKLAKVYLSVTSLDARLAGTLEPRASRPRRRLEAIRRLAEAGVPVGVMVAPVIPAVTDHEVEAILAACAQAGAKSAGYVLLRLPLEIKELWEEWLRAHVPDRADRVLAIVRQAHGGKLYDATWHLRGTGTGPYAELLARRFEVARARHGLDGGDDAAFDLDTSRFRPPAPPAKPTRQLPLF
jgi:DNA repair photolyase